MMTDITIGAAHRETLLAQTRLHEQFADLYFPARSPFGRRLPNKLDRNDKVIIGPWREYHDDASGQRIADFGWLSHNHVTQHVSGVLTQGRHDAALLAYQVDYDGMSIATGVDLDVAGDDHAHVAHHFSSREKALHAAQKLRAAAEGLELRPWLEITKSGGYRVMVFHARVPADHAQALGHLLLKQAGLNSKIEVFPKQTFPALTGNGLHLPYYGPSVVRGRQVMLTWDTQEIIPLAEFVPAAWDGRTTPERLAEIVQAAQKEGKIKAPATRRQPREGTPDSDSALHNPEHAPVAWQAQRAGCAALGGLAQRMEGGAEAGYDEWLRLATHLRAYGDWGHTEFHRLSACDARYDAYETDNLLDSLSGGPTVCDKMGCGRDPQRDCGLPASNVCSIALAYRALPKQSNVSVEAWGDPNKPEVQVGNRALDALTDECLDTLARQNEPPTVFVRDGHLARVVSGRGGAAIQAFNRISLRGVMAQRARFIVSHESSDGETRVSNVFPPLDVMEDMLVRGVYPDALPEIEGVVESPVFDRQGQLVVQEGYMPGVRLWCAPPDALTILDRAAVEQDVTDALAFFRGELFDGFPFAERASFAHTLAAMLLPLMRDMVEGPTPLVTITAPTRGTGKTKLAETIIAVSAPSGLKPFTAPGNEEEMRKTLTAYLRDTPPFVLIDNLEGRFSSESFCAAVTNARYSSRILGSNTEISVPVRACFLATANNVELHRDVASRSIEIRLDANMERPELRSRFKIADPPGFVKQKRSGVLSHAYMMVRWWVQQGCPRWKAQGKTRFREWEMVMGGLLESIGVEGFLSNLETSHRNSDPEHELWVEFVREWRSQFGGTNHTAKADYLLPLALGKWDLFGKHDGGGILTPLFVLRDEARAKQKLGYELKRRAGAVFDGCKIVKTDNARHSEWQLLMVEAGKVVSSCTTSPVAPLVSANQWQEIKKYEQCNIDTVQYSVPEAGGAGGEVVQDVDSLDLHLTMADMGMQL